MTNLTKCWEIFGHFGPENPYFLMHFSERPPIFVRFVTERPPFLTQFVTERPLHMRCLVALVRHFHMWVPLGGSNCQLVTTSLWISISKLNKGAKLHLLLKCRYKKRNAASRSEEDCFPVSFHEIVMSQNGAATRSYTYLDANWSVLRLCDIGFITMLRTVAKFHGQPDWKIPRGSWAAVPDGGFSGQNLRIKYIPSVYSHLWKTMPAKSTLFYGV